MTNYKGFNFRAGRETMFSARDAGQGGTCGTKRKKRVDIWRVVVQYERVNTLVK